MELLVVHSDREVPRRLLRLVRLLVSFQVSCPFCIDLNAVGYQEDTVTEDEVHALKTVGAWNTVASFSPLERRVLDYVWGITQTPVRVSQRLMDQLLEDFSPRALTILATTTAQVNLWARLIQGLGVQEAGFAQHEGYSPQLVELDRFRTRVP